MKHSGGSQFLNISSAAESLNPRRITTTADRADGHYEFMNLADRLSLSFRRRGESSGFRKMARAFFRDGRLREKSTSAVANIAALVSRLNASLDTWLGRDGLPGP